MYQNLVEINQKPEPFSFCTTEVLWNDPYISKQMLTYHLDGAVDKASRNSVFIERSIQWIKDHFSIGPGKQVCDFGCGPGLYTLGLARSGATVTGIDFSQRSINYAKKAAQDDHLPVHYMLENYLTYETEERFDLLLMIFCDFCVLDPLQRVHFLKKCRRLLKPDGAFLFDVCSYNAFEEFKEAAYYGHNLMDSFWSKNDYFGFMNRFRYPQEKISLDQYTIIEPNRTWKVYNWLQYYNLDTLSKTLRACGLDIAETYADVYGSPFSENTYEFAVAARPV